MYYSDSKNCNIIYDNSENILNDNDPCLGTSVDDYCCQSERNHCATGDTACSGCSSGDDCTVPGCWQWDGTKCTQSVYRLCTSAVCGTNINEICMGGCNGCPSESELGTVYTCPKGSYSSLETCDPCNSKNNTTCEQAATNTVNLTWCYDETNPSNTTGSCAPINGKCPSGLTAAWTYDDINSSGNTTFASQACACLASNVTDTYTKTNNPDIGFGTCQAAAGTRIGVDENAQCTWCYGVGADSAEKAVKRDQKNGIKNNDDTFFPGKIYPSGYSKNTCPYGAGISFAKSGDSDVCCEIGSGGAQTTGGTWNSGSCGDIEGSQCNWCYGGDVNESGHHGYAYPVFTKSKYKGTTPSDCDGGPITEHQNCCEDNTDSSRKIANCSDIKGTICDWAEGGTYDASHGCTALGGPTQGFYSGDSAPPLGCGAITTTSDHCNCDDCKASLRGNCSDCGMSDQTCCVWSDSGSYNCTLCESGNNSTSMVGGQSVGDKATGNGWQYCESSRVCGDAPECSWTSCGSQECCRGNGCGFLGICNG